METAAQWVGIAVTLLVAIVGWALAAREARATRAVAEQAEQRAERAEQRADRALELTERAEERARRAEAVSMERRHVLWRRIEPDDTASAGFIGYTNMGADTAHAAVLTITPADGGRRSTEPQDVGPGERLEQVLTDLAMEAQREWASLPDFVVSSAGFEVAVTITWESEAGVPGHATFGEEHIYC